MNQTPSWVIDGIILQCAGELLFDIGGTTEHRTQGRDTYLSCLEDFAFMIVYGNSFVTAGTMPDVLDKRPGELLASQFADLRLPPRREHKSSPGDLLLDEQYRVRIEDDLISLNRAYDLGRNHWEHWLFREARVYLGNDASLFDPACPKESMKFSKKPPYFDDQYLLDKIPQGFVDPLVALLQNRYGYKYHTSQALHEFICRSALSMIVVAWWFDMQSRDHYDGIRIPFVVRSLVKRSSGGELLVLRKRRIVRGLIVRHALADAVLRYRCTNRIEIVDALATIRDQEPYKTVRQLWGDLEYEMERGKDPGIDKVIQAIQDSSTSLEMLPDPLTMDSESLDDDQRPIRRALRRMIRYSMVDYEEQLERVFPELKETSGSERMVIMGDIIIGNKGIVQARGAKARDMTASVDNQTTTVNLEEASSQLEKLLSEILKSPEMAAHRETISAITSAKGAAEGKDRSGFMHHLGIAARLSGKLLYDMSTKVGASLIAEIIKQKCGF